jgi:predicted TIM-barrel fold metal-dependent hydrolase
MTAADGDRLHTTGQLDVIVEADGHVAETLDTIRPYVDDQYEAFHDFVERSPVPEFEMFPFTTATPSYLYREMEGDDSFSFFDASGVTPVADMMDEQGIDKAVVNNLGVVPLRDGDVAAGMITGINNWLIDSLRDQRGIAANMVVDYNRPAAAADEIDRVGGADDIVGVQVLGADTVPPLGHTQYDPLYEAAQRHGLPICVHTGTGPLSFPEQFYWSETYAQDHVVSHPAQHMTNIASILVNGVPERFPDVEWVMQEAGMGYVPYVLKRLDDAYAELEPEFGPLEKPPSEYARDSMYFCTQPLGHTADDPTHIAWLIDLVGPENVLFSADLPHPDFDTPAELFDRIASSFDAPAIRDMMGRNAEQVFGI